MASKAGEAQAYTGFEIGAAYSYGPGIFGVSGFHGQQSGGIFSSVTGADLFSSQIGHISANIGLIGVSISYQTAIPDDAWAGIRITEVNIGHGLNLGIGKKGYNHQVGLSISRDGKIGIEGFFDVVGGKYPGYGAGGLLGANIQTQTPTNVEDPQNPNDMNNRANFEFLNGTMLTNEPRGPHGPNPLNPSYEQSGFHASGDVYGENDSRHFSGTARPDGTATTGGAHSPVGPTGNSDGWKGGGAKGGVATFSQPSYVSSSPTQIGPVANGQEESYLDYLADDPVARQRNVEAYERASAKLEAEKLGKTYQQAQYQPATGKLNPTQQAHIATADLSRIFLTENTFFFTGSILAEGISGHDNASYNTAARAALAGDSAFHNGGSFFDAYEGAGGNRYSDAAYDAYENSIDSHLASNDFARAHSDWRADTGGDGGGDGNNAKPILIDLDGDGLEIVSGFENFVLFDTDDTGLIHRSSWAGAGDGVLFFDADGDGTISSAREYIFTEWDPTAGGDMEALRAVFDSNGDGKLSAADAQFAAFKVMVTLADGSTQAVSLAQAGIASIDLIPDAAWIELPDGSMIKGEARFTRTDGTTGTIGNAVFERDGQGYKVLQETSIAAGVRTVVTSGFAASGDLAFRTTASTSADGLSRTVNNDENGDGVIDTIRTVVTSIAADGTRTETRSDFTGSDLASAALAAREVIISSANGGNVTRQVDSTGGGWFDASEVRVTNANGSRTTTTRELAQDGSVIRSQTQMLSADGKTRTVSVDEDGNGVAEAEWRLAA